MGWLSPGSWTAKKFMESHRGRSRLLSLAPAGGRPFPGLLAQGGEAFMSSMGSASLILKRACSDFAMQTVSEKEAAIYQFLEVFRSDPSQHHRLLKLENLPQINQLIQDQGLPLSAALIPIEQATRPPKILVESAVINNEIPWRILRCPGGPLVLQVITKSVSFAVWAPEC